MSRGDGVQNFRARTSSSSTVTELGVNSVPQGGSHVNPWPIGTQVKVSNDPNDPADAELALSEMRHILVIKIINLGILMRYGYYALIHAS